MTYTWDGQPAADLDAAIDAVIAAAWCAGRDAAAKAVAAIEMVDCDGIDEEVDGITQDACYDAVCALTPPPDLLSTLRPGGTP